MGVIQKLQARFELKRLEQRYVTRKKRQTWMSDAVYVDGEYVFPSSPAPIPSFAPTSPTTSQPSSSSTRRSTNSSWSWSSKGPAARIRAIRGRIAG